MTTLTAAQFELFERLTERTFLVLDTEYCTDPDGGLPRLISLGLTPVVRGKRTNNGELYIEMNPCVPIDEATAAVHGFTDAYVARKRRFPHYAPAVLRALDVEDAVLVGHTGADIGVLRGELERLDQAGGNAVGFDDLPDLPIVDTSTLPRLLRHPVAGTSTSVSLAALCAATGVANRAAHDAKADARATADALIQLLVHAAASMSYDGIEALLADHDRGTTRTPRLALHISSRNAAPSVPAAHLARHAAPLTHRGDDAEVAAWLELAGACVQLRCEHLRVEARLAAAENAHALLAPMTALMTGATEPGQPGTLLGALAELLMGGTARADPPATTLVLPGKRVFFWWRALLPDLKASAPCAGKLRCPDCWEGNGCARDTLYKAVANLLTHGEDPTLTRKRVKNMLFGSDPRKRVNAWSQGRPAIAAHMTWLVATWAEGQETSPATFLDKATSLRLEEHDPHLALMVCRNLAEAGSPTAVEDVAKRALERATTDPAYDELRTWTTWREQAAELHARRSAPRVIVEPRRARPGGRVNPNPYLPRA
ncbi:hypothetical protein GCM10009641_28650 [Mycobacterium cookii]|uniref:Exonuclease domain-containing protein n=1 Tax=Nocardioides furvisabuli TaxID=375542 RepID=A0ABP5J7F3_9ACTN|nr:3'-5' exonuclease [Nocardioides furvisabuli]